MAERTRQRITELDGLRAVAILGVLFAHIWAFGCGAPALTIFGVDWNRLFSIFGTGVDLFFVISGFCMHLMFASKNTSLSASNYRNFLWGRAKRIVPAYLVAMVFSAGVWVVSTGQWPLREVLAHLVFGQTLVPGATKLASPFWSLATEWHFYMVLPFLLFLGKKRGEPFALWVFFLASVFCRALVLLWHNPPISLDMLLPSRLCEFVLGVAVSRQFQSGKPLPRLLSGTKGAALGFVVMFAGRLLMTDGIVRGRGFISMLAMTINIPLLALGYAMIVWNAIGSESIVAKALRTAPMLWLGRVSYSFYLWHWFPALWIGAYFTTFFGARGFVPLLSTLVATAALSPLAALSYRLFEAPYFAKRGNTAQGGGKSVSITEANL